ncbi:MAG TPA: DUF1223 domain-containing protein [Polyangia bacterium]|nr:DUF1223 domain-containing protein [Polyangia bacterium]
MSIRFMAPFLFLAACTPAVGATTDAVRAPTRTVLVELFTSQGCSSCPAADAFVRDFPSLGLTRARVVPLTFHVDYWNDLGWPDPFSSPAFTARQQRYAEAGHLRGPSGGDAMTGLYTPQMIVDGTVHFSGGRRETGLDEIRRAGEAPALIEIEGDAIVEGDHAIVTLYPRAHGSPRDWEVFVALAAKSARTSVSRGENRGETLEEAAVVRALSAPVRPSFVANAPPLRISVTKPRDLAWSAVELAAVVQSPKTMQVGAALSLTPREGATKDARGDAK